MSEATDQVIAGLEGVLACESSIAFIDGSIPELSFRGYHIHDIAQTLTFEQITFLLWYDRIPQGDELKTFSDDLAARRPVPGAVVGDALVKALTVQNKQSQLWLKGGKNAIK